MGRKIGTSDLPLHYGKAPAWPFEKMGRLSCQVAGDIVSEYGPGTGSSSGGRYSNAYQSGPPLIMRIRKTRSLSAFSINGEVEQVNV